MAKRELIDIEDAITECRNSFDISEAVVNMRDWCHIITEQEIVKLYLDKLKAEIENHCGLAKENHCKYCSYCNSVMGVREILEIIDKYKAESEE